MSGFIQILLPGRWRLMALVGMALFMAIGKGFAQGRDSLNFPPPAQAPTWVATALVGSLQLDGKLQEQGWQQVPWLDSFYRIEPRQGGPVRYATRVKVLFDKTQLYFGVFCKDSFGRKGLRVQDLRRDFEFGENDIFFLQLDPQNLQRYCVSFQTTPYGNQRDLQVFDDALRDNDWDALWQVRTQRTDSGWYAEFAIPFKSLRYDGQNRADTSLGWGFTFSRLARREYEQTVFPAIPQAFTPYRMNYAARLKGLKLPPPSINLRLQPYGLYQFSRFRNAAGESRQEQAFKVGGEAKWAINPKAVLDLTINTDFAQADVDRAVNNLTRFNVFFPERRQFFLENNGIYAGANNAEVKPFFSRAIGLANNQFNADPVPIQAGLRYTDRSLKRAIAGLYVRQQATANQPAAQFFVARYLKNFGRQNNLGMMVTHRLDEASAKFGQGPRHNTTLSIDGFYRPDNSWTIKYLVTASRNNRPDSIGLAARLAIERSLPKWYYKYSLAYVDAKYQPGMGFVFAQNAVHHNPGGYFIYRPKSSKLIRRFDPGVFLNYYHNANNGRFQQAELDIFPVYFIFSDNSVLSYDWLLNWQLLEFPFKPVGITIGKGSYRYQRHQVAYKSDASKKLSASVDYNWGGYFDLRLHTLNTWLRLAPTPHLALRAAYERNQFRREAPLPVNLTTHLYTGELRMAANPRLQASLLYQYNSYDQRGRWNVRGSWEFAPLSFVYLVFNENAFANSLVRNQSVINKITWLKQF